jgi:glutamate/tyrosine decarboxylase-like PLP-dependent enzyme
LIAWITDYWERIESLPVLPAIGDLCREQGIWFHIDGAMSGTTVAIQQQ